MTDAFGISRATFEQEGAQLETTPMQRLVIIPSPAPREPRPVTSLAKVFGQFAELQNQIAGQVSELETSVLEQRQDLSTAIAQLPEMRERINWLIASFWEQNKKEEVVREQLSRHDASLAALEDTVRSLCAAQGQWKSALEEVIDVLLRARAFSVPAPPQAK